MTDILSHFPPGFTPRPIQVDILERTVAAFGAGKRFVILEAPPGVGKSLCAVTLARACGPTYILTLTKQLQAQYTSEFRPIGARELKGRSAFQCPNCGDTCAIGGKRFKYPKQCEPCDYKIAKKRALAAPICICNYASYLANIYPTQGGLRPLLVCDEAHVLEDTLLSHISITIAAGTLPIPVREPFPLANDVDACFDWLVGFLVDAANYDRERLSEKAEIELEHLEKKAAYALECRDREHWIVEPVEGKTGFALKPLTVRSFGEERVFQYGERVLLMSATILDAEKMADSLGIDPAEMAFVSAPCPFPKEHRQVVASTLNMTMGHRNRSWPAMVAQIQAIMEGHSEEKGLLLTPSNEMLKYIQGGLSQDQAHRLVLASGATRLAEYNRHCDSTEPTVLAACGYWEGADLFGDRSRFQIIPAIPRPCWKGQIAARGNMDPRWYRMKSIAKLIQGTGRSVRSGSDFCATYVLDGALRREAEAPDSLLPDWFREAIVFVG